MNDTDTSLDIDTWTHALPPAVRRQVHRTYAVIAAVGAAVANGWDPVELAKVCSENLGTAANVGGVVLSRLQNAATVGPPVAARFDTFTRPKCGNCNPDRWIEDPETGAPVARCECAG